MTNRIFIIDDNHSQVDSLKVMLQDLPLQYESAFRFQEARTKLEARGASFNQGYYKQLEELAQEMEKQTEEDSETKRNFSDVIEQDIENPLNDDGIFLILVEHDTENNTKGIDFIQNMLRSQDAWQEKDFILMTSRPEVVQKKAQELGIFVLEKPIQFDILKQVILERITAIQENQNKVNTLMEKLAIKSFPVYSDPSAKPPKRKPRASKKASS